MTKCEECGQEKPKEDVFRVRGVIIGGGIAIIGQYAEDIFGGETIEDCIKKFVEKWSLRGAISVNFTVIKRP